MGETLTRKYGPLPVWAWALILTAGLAWYMTYRKKKAAAAAAQQQQQLGQAGSSSSNLGTVPVSNLTTAAQPMPIQLGDTFVNTGAGGGVSTTNGSPATTVITNTPTSANTLLPAAPPSASPATQVG